MNEKQLPEINGTAPVDVAFCEELDNYITDVGLQRAEQHVLARICQHRNISTQETPLIEEPQALRPMRTAPRDGSFILIQHNIDPHDTSDDAEITFSLCHWGGDGDWYYSTVGGLYILRDQHAHGWIPQPAMPE